MFRIGLIGRISPWKGQHIFLRGAHASTTGEPFGQVIIEGMAAGKPVVATNGGGVPEIVEDGKTGLLVPMRDPSAMAEAICRLLSDPSLARKMGQRGWERVANHFTAEQTARKVESVYAEVLGRSSTEGCPSPFTV